MRRANRIAIERTETGYVARYFKTHTLVGTFEATNAEWQASKDANATKAREEFRDFAIAQATQNDIEWKPELQAQAWERKYWKYEADSQVEEDATTLMAWTIKKLSTKAQVAVEVQEIALDSIVPTESNLGYVESGRYTKTGNWAVATVNLAVSLKFGEMVEDIIYPIEMRSGQLTKIKMDANEFRAMVADVFNIKEAKEA